MYNIRNYLTILFEMFINKDAIADIANVKRISTVKLFKNPNTITAGATQIDKHQGQDINLDIYFTISKLLFSITFLKGWVIESLVINLTTLKVARENIITAHTFIGK